MAAITGLNQEQVKIWFQNNRYKTKKAFKEKGISHSPTVHAPPHSAHSTFLNSERFGRMSANSYNGSLGIPQTNYYGHNHVPYGRFLPNYHNPPVPFPTSWGAPNNFTQVNPLTANYHAGSFLMPPNPFYLPQTNPTMMMYRH